MFSLDFIFRYLKFMRATQMFAFREFEESEKERTWVWQCIAPNRLNELTHQTYPHGNNIQCIYSTIHEYETKQP